jgi:hypothetical protein
VILITRLLPLDLPEAVFPPLNLRENTIIVILDGRIPLGILP